MKKIILALLALVSFNAQAQIAPLPWSQQFSAEQDTTIPNGPKINSKIYVDNDKVRVEVNAMGMQMINIMRMDKNTMYIVMPQQKMITTIPLSPKESSNIIAFDAKNLKHELLGEESVDGINCEKYKLSYETSPPMIFWINKTTRTPVAMQSQAGDVKVSWRNVVPGPQAASLFEPPTGYQTMNMPSMPGAGSPSTLPMGQ